jgi:uncharacterized protein YuzE
MRMSYDKAHDVLYLAFEETDNECDYLELENGDILRIDPKTNAVVGCTLMAFSRRVREGELNVPAVGELALEPRIAIHG